MNIRALILVITICGVATLTGCASKQAVKTDPGKQSSTLPANTAPPAATSGNSSDASVVSQIPTESVTSAPVAENTTVPASNAGTELHLAPVYFDFDSYLLRGDARDTLTRNAGWLAENRLARITIAGHADERGADEYNLALSEKRAIAVKRYIETLGINPDRMETVGYGENIPVVIGHDEAAWSKNRRAEFVQAR